MSDAEENITLNVEETEDTQKAAEEAEAKRIADEAEAKRIADEAEAKRIADEAEAKRIADETAAKKAEEEAEAKRIADEAEAKRVADEAAAKKAGEEAEAKRIADEAEAAEKAELAEQLAEIERLNNITNKLWKEEGIQGLTHTAKNIKKMDMKNRARVHQNFMTSLTKTSQRKRMIKSTTSIKSKRPNLTTRQTMVNSGMMFGNRR